jgi:hypothetical protein
MSPGATNKKGKIMKYALLVHKSQEQFDRPDAQTLRLKSLEHRAK